MNQTSEELVFVPLGGLGEIGMNAGLYGIGPKNKRKWLMVDCGVTFAGPELPGIDLIVPDVSFIAKIKRDLVGLVITHAHEDHIGAVADLWPRLGCEVYATPFAAGLLETKRLSEPGAPQVPLKVVGQGGIVDIGPFSVEFIAVAHSIPEACALAIRTSAGTVLHTGDWKIDLTPVMGRPTDEARLREIGDEGVLALVCDSTNILRDGVSPSETEVAATMAEIIAGAPNRVMVTTFASNVGRIKAVALAAAQCGRSVLIAGRALERAVAVARECGLLDHVAPFLPADLYRNMPRNKVVIVATGSQGEPRAAMARIAAGIHPDLTLAPGDQVIFSSRPIPGNEKGINNVINGLIDQGVEVITDRQALVHVSGHPRRSEVAQMYDWVRPQIAIPAHGEALHLGEHAKFARDRGVPHVINAHNGDMVLLSPGTPGVVDQVPHGRLLKDGNILVPMQDEAIKTRVKLSLAGVVTIAYALDAKGQLAGDPDVLMAGLPAKTKDGSAMDALVDEAIFRTLDNQRRARRRDTDASAQAVERAVRSAVGQAWGKKPMVHVLVVEV